MHTITKLLDRIDKLEERICLSGKRCGEWVSTRWGALLIVRVIAELRYLAERNPQLTPAVQARAFTPIADAESLEAAQAIADVRLAEWRQADKVTAATTEELS
jgi:hypothetical protein